MGNRAGNKLDLAIVGSGLAGTAAACFAVNRGLKVAQVSATSGELTFASGLLDLLERYPLEERKRWANPWEGLAALIAGSPRHPYALLGIDAIREAIAEFTEFTEAAGFRYRGHPDLNTVLPTAAGTVRSTYRVPESMWAGALALEQRLPTLLVDFEGMKDFNARLMAEGLRRRWPGLKAQRYAFPAKLAGDDRPAPVLVGAMESPDVVARLADLIVAHLDGIKAVGLPAVLGIRSTARILTDLQERLQVLVFEVPTLPPAVTGLRLREAVDPVLLSRGAQICRGRFAISVLTDGKRCTGIVTGREKWRETLEAEGIILATGRFVGGGLSAERGRIRENLFGLPVAYPSDRASWHRESFLDSRGHPVSEAGLEVDDQFRPLGAEGKCAYENVFAAGSVLAHQNWVRSKSGAGIAIATALGAVKSFLANRREGGTES